MTLPQGATGTTHGSAAITLALDEGTLFARDYRVGKPLARGGMGAVYVARQLSTDKDRALKIMLPEIVGSEKQRARFELEAKVGAQIESDHVVEVVAAGVDDVTGLPYLVMELLEGRTLATTIRDGAPMTPAELLELFGQMCHALGRAHEKGIVHRDLKPDNIFLANPRTRGVPFTVKVLDFGIARLTREAKTEQTSAIGTPAFMAPEQFQGEGIVPATDVWALGLIAFRALARCDYWNNPVSGESTPLALMMEVAYGGVEPASVRAIAHGSDATLPPGFDRWFLRCLAKDPAHRFATAHEAFFALEIALGVRAGEIEAAPAATVRSAMYSRERPPGSTRMGEAPTVRDASLHPPAPTVAASAHPAANAPSAPARPSRSAAAFIVLGLVGVIAMGAAAVAMTRATSETSTPTPAASSSSPPAARPSRDITECVTARASSSQSGHPPALAFDGRAATAWTEGAAGDGTGEWIEADLPPGTVVSYVEVSPGWSMRAADGDRWELNGSFKTMRVSWDGGSVDVPFARTDRGVKKRIDIGKQTKSVRLLAVAVHRGRFEDLSLDDVTVFGSVDGDCR